jgi:hypothetical protein
MAKKKCEGVDTLVEMVEWIKSCREPLNDSLHAKALAFHRDEELLMGRIRARATAAAEGGAFWCTFPFDDRTLAPTRHRLKMLLNDEGISVKVHDQEPNLWVISWEYVTCKSMEG